MNCKMIKLTGTLIFALLLSTGCSKKVTKIQPNPESPKIKVEQDVIPPAEEDFFQPQEMDAQMREIFTPIYFDYDRYNILNSEISKMEKIATLLKENSRIRVLIEGHCDERGSSEYNMGLGENRAQTIQKWLIAYGISQSRIETTSYGKERPARTGCDNDICSSKNRRDEWIILSK